MDLKLFECSADELKEISLDAQYDRESEQLIIDENNCEHKDGIIFFKQPLLAKNGIIAAGILNRIAIVKDIKIDVYSYTFVLAVSESEKDNDSLLKFYDTYDLGRFNCICSWGHIEGWYKFIGDLR